MYQGIPTEHRQDYYTGRGLSEWRRGYGYTRTRSDPFRMVAPNVGVVAVAARCALANRRNEDDTVYCTYDYEQRPDGRIDATLWWERCG